MIVRMKIECRDAMEQAIEKMAEDEVGGPVDSKMHDIAFRALVDETKDALAKWCRRGEMRITVDTDAGTCVVEEA